MELIHYVPIIIYVVIYAVVFLIQKSQIDKQKEIMGKYEKMFNIINIDEIEKYVDLKEKGLKLDFENREKEIKKVETTIGVNLSKSEAIISQLNNLKEERNDLELRETDIKVMIEVINKDLKDTKIQYDLMSKLYELEFEELYSLFNNYNDSKIVNNVIDIRKDYLKKRKEILIKK